MPYLAVTSRWLDVSEITLNELFYDVFPRGHRFEVMVENFILT